MLPEILLVATACLQFLVAPFLVSERGEAASGLRHRWGGIAVLAFATAGWLWWRMEATESTLGLFQSDSLTFFVRGLSLASGVLVLLTSWNLIDDARSAEHHACLLLLIAGVNLVVAANDLIVLFLALELVSMTTYVLLFLGRSDAMGLESVLKYFLLSAFSSAMMLLGLGYLYGVTGTTNLSAMHAVLTAGNVEQIPTLLVIGLAGILAGLAAKIAIVPFHFYAPDVFQGTGIGAAAMLSFVPKVAGFIALMRLLIPPGGNEGGWSLVTNAETLLWVLAIISMTLGNVMALLQTNVWRLLAYSSIAHAGYMLVGLAVVPREAGSISGSSATLFYLAVYGAMTLGIFAALAAVRVYPNGSTRSSDRIESIDDLAGLGRTSPIAAIFLAIFLFSLTGLPPTAGFFAKLNLFLAAWGADTSLARGTACLMALNAAVAGWYYLRLVAIMYVQPEQAEQGRATELPGLVGATLCAIAVLGAFILPDWLWQLTSRAAG